MSKLTLQRNFCYVGVSKHTLRRNICYVGVPKRPADVTLVTSWCPSGRPDVTFGSSWGPLRTSETTWHLHERTFGLTSDHFPHSNVAQWRRQRFPYCFAVLDITLPILTNGGLCLVSLGSSIQRASF